MPGLERSAAFLVMPLVFLWTWTIGFELTRIQTSWIRRMGLVSVPTSPTEEGYLSLGGS
jgi:hypothetical protein